MCRKTQNKEIDRVSRIDPQPNFSDRVSSVDPHPNFSENTMHPSIAKPIIWGVLKIITDKIPGPMAGIIVDQVFANHANVTIVVLSLKSPLAGIIMGKRGTNSKEIMHISKAVLRA